MVRLKNVHVLIALILVVSALMVWWFHDSSSTFRVADRDFSVSRDLEILRVVMKSGTETDAVVLRKDVNDRWRLNDGLYANDLAVRELISVLSRLMVKQPVSIANSEAVTRMLQEQGVEVKVFIKANRLSLDKWKFLPYERLYQSIIIGEDTPDQESTYMRKTRSRQAFKVHRPGYERGVSDIFTPELRVWRDPVLIDATWEEIDLVEIWVTDRPDESFVVRNIPDKEFAFHKNGVGEEELLFDADTVRIRRFLSSFRDIYYESLLDADAEIYRQQQMFEQPFMQITVLLKDGTHTRISAYARRHQADQSISAGVLQRDPNRFYVKINDGEYALAQYYVFNRIMRPLSFFQN